MRATAPPRAERAGRLPSFFRDPSYLLYMGAHATSLIGDAAFFVALGWAAAQLDDPFLTSIVLAAGSVPRALLLLPGGALVDRHGVRRLMLGSDLLRAAVMLAAAGGVAAVGPVAWLLVVVALVFGVVDAVYLPAASSMPRLLLRPEQMTKAISFGQIVMRLGPMLGGPLGGFAVAYGGFGLACLVNGVTFLLVFGVLLAVRPRYPSGREATPEPAAGEGGTTNQLLAGLRYVRRDPLLSRMLLVAALSNVAIAPVTGLGVALRAEGEGWGAGALGWLQGAIGLGAVLGALAVLVLPEARRPGVHGMVWIGIQAACSVAFALSPTAVVAAVALFVMGTTFGVASALLGGVTIGRIEPAYLGRTMALSTVSSYGLVPISYVAFGGLAGVIGVSATCIVAAGVSGVTCIWGLASPVLRSAQPLKHAPDNALTSKNSTNPPADTALASNDVKSDVTVGLT